MKAKFSVLSLVLICLFVSWKSVNSITPLLVGADMPAKDVVIEDVSGEKLTLEKIKKENGLLVIFSCNTCPFVLGWEDRYRPIGEFCAANNIGMVLVNSNEAKRETDDSIDKMKEHAAEKRYNSFYALDKNHRLADAFGATRTPEVFLFDKNGKLVYKGAIDDNMEDAAAVSQAWLNNALKNVISGATIQPAETKSIGCTIKRIQ